MPVILGAPLGTLGLRRPHPGVPPAARFWQHSARRALRGRSVAASTASWCVASSGSLYPIHTAIRRSGGHCLASGSGRPVSAATSGTRCSRPRLRPRWWGVTTSPQPRRTPAPPGHHGVSRPSWGVPAHGVTRACDKPRRARRAGGTARRGRCTSSRSAWTCGRSAGQSRAPRPQPPRGSWAGPSSLPGTLAGLSCIRGAKRPSRCRSVRARRLSVAERHGGLGIVSASLTSRDGERAAVEASGAPHDTARQTTLVASVAGSGTGGRRAPRTGVHRTYGALGISHARAGLESRR